MTICNAISNAVSNLQTSGGGGLVQSLGEVLGALGAADVGIRIGSGGQVGVLDLPSLLSSTAGIPCFSPELGDFIYITPLQWYANGMSCSGLRDRDREELEERIRERQRRAEDANTIRQSLGIPRNVSFPSQTPSDVVNRIADSLKDSTNGFGPNGRSLEFVVAGALLMQDSVAKIVSDFRNDAYAYGIGENKTFLIEPGDRLQIETIMSPPDPILFSFQRYIHLKDKYGNYKTGVDGLGRSRTGYTLFYQNVYVGNYSWATQQSKHTPSFNPAPPTNVGYENGFTPSYPINPITPREPPEETPCMGGCSCRDIAGAQQQRLNNLEKLVKEIHKAVAAQNFISPYTFSPEANIENAGKKIYQNGFGRAGTIQVNNLLEAVNALVAAEYYRLGLQRFPAKVPASLIPNPNAALEAVDRNVIDISDLAGFQEWWFKQWNAQTGKWPIEFEITDDGKTKPFKLWNLEHALAELFAQQLKIVEDADQSVQWGIRAATEASKSGNAALKALHLLNELVKLTGAITGNNTIKVKSTFTPNLDSWQGAGQTTEEMLKSSEQDLIVTDIKDNRTLIGLLLHISYYVQIAAKAVYQSLDINPATRQPGMPGDAIKAERKKEKEQNSKAERDWDNWKKQAEQPISNAGMTPDAVNPPTPKITEVQKPKT